MEKQLDEHDNILRSMSKAGTSIDNAVIEALNGWIKAELRLDLGLETVENVPKLKFITSIISGLRPLWTLGNNDGKIIRYTDMTAEKEQHRSASGGESDVASGF